MTPHVRCRTAFRKRADYPELDAGDDEDEQFASTQSTQGDWYEIDQIIAEKATRYRVLWKGHDPQTGEPWKPEWVKKDSVTEAARQEWEAKKGKKDTRKGKRKRQRQAVAEVVTPTKRSKHRIEGSSSQRPSQRRLSEEDSTQTSEYRPTQKLAQLSQVSSPLPRILSRERPTDPFFPSGVLRGDTPVTPGPSPRSSPGFSVVIQDPRGFDATQYPRFSDIILVPDTQTDSSVENIAITLDLENDPIEFTQPERVIADSQGFDDDPDFSTCIYTSPLKEPEGGLQREHNEDRRSVQASTRPSDDSFLFGDAKEFLGDASIGPQHLRESPPPSYQESISQSTTNSGIFIPSQAIEVPVQLVEAPVQISRPEEEPESEFKAVQKPGEQRPAPESESESGQSQNFEESDTFDLDLPQHLYLPYRPLAPAKQVTLEAPPKDNQAQEGIAQKPLSGETVLAKPTQPPEEVRKQRDPNAKASEPARQSAEGTRLRSRRFQGTKLEDWFRIERRAHKPQNSDRQFSSFPYPPDTLSRHTDSGFPHPPSLSRSMSEALSPSLPARPGSLREKLEANKRRMEEELARKSASMKSSLSRSSSAVPPENSSRMASVSRIPPTSQMEPHSEPEAQVPLYPLPSITQDLDTIMSTEAPTPTPPTKEKTLDSKPKRLSPRSMFEPPILGPAEYAVGLPLSTTAATPGGLSQKAVYLHEIVKKHADIENFLTDHDNAPLEVKESTFDLVRCVAQISTHPNLTYPVTPLSTDEKEAEFQATMSAKFRFLKDLFPIIKEENVKIAVVAEAPALIDMLEVFFRGIKIAHKRLDKLSTLTPIPEDDIEGMAQVFLVPSMSSGVVGSECHVVIAMDSTFDAHSPEVIQIRKNTYHPAMIAPVLRLIAVNTIEHALVCVSPDADRLYACVEAIKILRQDAGVMDHTYEAATQDIVKQVGQWIGKKCEGNFNIPPLPELPLFESVLPAPSPATTHEVDAENADKRKRHNSIPEFLDGNVSDAKKRRVLEGPVSSEPAHTADITHINNTMPNQLPPPQIPLLSHEEIVPAVIQDHDLDIAMDLDDETESEPEPELAFVFAQPMVPPGEESPLEEKSHAELVAMVKQGNSDLKSWIESQGRLQTRFEMLQQVSRDAKAQIKILERSEKQAIARKDRAIADVEKLNVQIRDLNTRLSQAQQLLHAEQPEVERLLTENEDFKKKLAHANNKIGLTEKEADFAREQYQNASNATFEIRKELNQSQQENAMLRRKADETVIILHRTRNDEALRKRDGEIEDLKLRLKEREDRIVKLIEQRDGGYGPKRNSVQRRVGSPAQSRGSSPNLAALRNRGDV